MEWSDERWADERQLDNLTDSGYPNLAGYGWKPGIHRAPAGYEHPWLVVTRYGTGGCWNRAEARRAWAVLGA